MHKILHFKTSYTIFAIIYVNRLIPVNLFLPLWVSY